MEQRRASRRATGGLGRHLSVLVLASFVVGQALGNFTCPLYNDTLTNKVSVEAIPPAIRPYIESIPGSENVDKTDTISQSNNALSLVKVSIDSHPRVHKDEYARIPYPSPSPLHTTSPRHIHHKRVLKS